MNAEKKELEDETMAIISTEWRKQIKAMEEEAEARAYGKIIGALVDEGLANYGQILIGPQKLQKALRKVVLPELIRQDGLKSTGGAGKYNDIAQRMLYHINRDTCMEIIDLRCRPLSMADITVVIDTTDKRTAEAMDGKARVGVEQKTGAGALAQTEDELISWKMLERACDEGRLICWFPFSIPNWQEGNLDTLDDVPYFFGTYDMLFSTLYQYREDIRTWLKVCGNAVNFQNVTTSGKKIAFLEEACEGGWNWPLFRDWGRIREK